MTNDSRYILLEYNQQQGLFHYNTIYNGRFNSEPNTYGWEPIALTLESKASLFCNIADAVKRNHSPSPRSSKDGKASALPTIIWQQDRFPTT